VFTVSQIYEIDSTGISQPMLIPRPWIDFDKLKLPSRRIPFEFDFRDARKPHALQQANSRLHQFRTVNVLDDTPGSEFLGNLQKLLRIEPRDETRLSIEVTGGDKQALVTSGNHLLQQNTLVSLSNRLILGQHLPL